MGYLFILTYLVIILAVIEINAIIFTMTGLDKEISRFQVISMLTGTGFTTGESELIIGHPIRRRVGAFLILFGAFSLAVVISSISGILSDEFLTKEIGYVAGLLILIMLLLRTSIVQKKLSKTFKGEMQKNFDLEDLPIRDVFLQSEEDYFAHIPIHRESSLIGKLLIDVLNKEDDINVLFIKRGEIVIRHARLETEIQAGDLLFLFGNNEGIREKFKDELAEITSKDAKPASSIL